MNEITDWQPSSAELALLRQLQRVFKATTQLLSQWGEIFAKCQTSVSSIANQSEQYQCCRRVDLQSSALSAFPDIQTRLCNKIIQSLEHHTDTLTSALQSMEENQAKLSKACQTAKQVYYRDKLSLEEISAGTPYWPPAVTLLEWSADIDRIIQQEHACRAYVVQTLDFSKPETVTKLEQCWTKRIAMSSPVENILSKTRYLIDEKL